ncbi:MAG: DUF6323 family protein [Huintestinicola sp.]
MENNNTSFSLISVDAAISERQVTNKILLCNEETKKYGLSLTEHQALSLAQTRKTSLTDSKRIEFGSGIVDKLIMAVCDSPYITQEIYEETLHELIELFYNLKNDTWDRVSDDDLISFIKTAFNGCCHGSMELLAGKAMYLAEHIHSGKTIDTFCLKEE